MIDHRRAHSLRPFIGAKDYTTARAFYRDLDFTEVVISQDMSLIKVNDQLGFYLQDCYVKDWCDNLMLFLEVEDLDEYYQKVYAKKLPERYAGVRLLPIRTLEWGREFFLHDPSGILWHIGHFY